MSAAAMAFANGVATVTGRLALRDGAASLSATGFTADAEHLYRCLVTDLTGNTALAPEALASADGTTITATVDLSGTAALAAIQTGGDVAALVAWYDETESEMLGAAPVPVALSSPVAEVEVA